MKIIFVHSAHGTTGYHDTKFASHRFRHVDRWMETYLQLDRYKYYCYFFRGDDDNDYDDTAMGKINNAVYYRHTSVGLLYFIMYALHFCLLIYRFPHIHMNYSKFGVRLCYALTLHEIQSIKFQSRYCYITITGCILFYNPCIYWMLWSLL